MNRERLKLRIKQAGIMDSLAGMAPEGLGGLMGAGSAAGLSQMAGLGGKGQMIAAAIGATIGAMAANKMKDHEQMQMQGIDSNSQLGIQNALMNLDQQSMMTGMDPYAGMGMSMPGGMQDPSMMGMDPSMMGMDPSMMGMDPSMMGMQDPSMAGMPVDPYGNAGQLPMQQPQTVSGYPDAMQAMQQPKQASVNLTKTASDLVDRYFA